MDALSRNHVGRHYRREAFLLGGKLREIRNEKYEVHVPRLWLSGTGSGVQK